MARTVTLTESLSASTDVLWHACADPHGMTLWQADEANGQTEAGNVVTLAWPALGVEIELEVVEVEPPRRIVLQGAHSTVEFRVTPGNLSVTHAGLRDEDEAQGIESSWRVALSLLRHALERHPGRTRTATWIVEPVITDPAMTSVYFTEPCALRSWLAVEATSLAGVNAPYALTTTWGERISGRTLCSVPNRDVAISWTEDDDSVLTFRTFPGRPQSSGKTQRLVAISWSRFSDSAPDPRTKPEFQRCLERLRKVLESAPTA